MIGSIGNSPMTVPTHGAVGLPEGQRPDGTRSSAESQTRFSGSDRKTDSDQSLTEGEIQQVREMKQRDREVRAHERAHMAAGAGLVKGGATFSMQRGPDDRMYAVGGEVSIDTSSEKDPEATIRKMQQVKRAALAPADPSSTDRAVAARAGQIEAQARQEKNSLEAAARSGPKRDDQDNGAPPVASDHRPYNTEALGKALNIVA